MLYDFHDEEMVDWRSDDLGKIEAFCYENILGGSPPRFRPTRWIVLLSVSVIVTLGMSFILYSINSWVSNMLGNVAAGLIASLVLLLYTTRRDRYIAYHENLLPSLQDAVREIDRIDTKVLCLYYPRKPQLMNDKTQYHLFFMKWYLYMQSVADVFGQVLESQYSKGYSLKYTAKDISNFKNETGKLLTAAALACDGSERITLDEVDKQMRQFWQDARNMYRILGAFVQTAQLDHFALKYGAKAKQPLSPQAIKRMQQKALKKK